MTENELINYANNKDIAQRVRDIDDDDKKKYFYRREMDKQTTAALLETLDDNETDILETVVDLLGRDIKKQLAAKRNPGYSVDTLPAILEDLPAYIQAAETLRPLLEKKLARQTATQAAAREKYFDEYAMPELENYTYGDD